VQNLIKKYLDSLERAQETGAEIAKRIADTLQPIIPDIKWSLGWEEGGIMWPNHIICFYSDQCNVNSVEDLENSESLQSLIEQVFPELKFCVDTPSGVYVPKEQCTKVIELLKELKGANVSSR